VPSRVALEEKILSVFNLALDPEMKKIFQSQDRDDRGVFKSVQLRTLYFFIMTSNARLALITVQ
jgi:hypothetical protein